MYTSHNFKTKKELKEAVNNGAKITVFQPNNLFNTPTPMQGTVYLEGPHFPKPHTWYAKAELKDGFVVKVS